MPEPTDFEAILRKHMDGEFSLFACGAEGAPSEADIAAFETTIGFALPGEFRAFSKSPLGGLYVEVKEEIWPRPKEFDVGPFWSFLYGLFVYGFGREIPEWMDIRRQAEAFRRETEAWMDLQPEAFRRESKQVPFLKIIGDADVYCFGEDGRIARWSHETGEFEAEDRSFSEVLDFELGELKARKERKKVEGASRPSA
jgi:hypothetical protein